MLTNCILAQMPAVAKRTAPLKGKLVFLDTKAPVSKLREQLELLGARVETFFSKDIWCVITDKQIDEANKKLLSLAANAVKVSDPIHTRVLFGLRQAPYYPSIPSTKIQNLVESR